MGSNFSVLRLAQLAAIDFGIQFVGWAASSLLHTERLFDLTGSLTYWCLIIRAYAFAHGGNSDVEGAPSTRQRAAAVMVLVWSLRLGAFLAKRAYKYGDSRFLKAKHDPGLFFIFWMIQGFWCLLTPLPGYLLLSQNIKDTVPLGLVDYASWSLSAVGFVVEVVADWQKSAWRDAGNTQFVQSGLWRYCQHPNYFGEMLFWAAYCAPCFKALHGWGAKAASVASPVFVAFLLRFVSGVPLLQKAASAKYGSDPIFQAYSAGTSLIIPWFPSSSSLTETEPSE